MIETAWNTIPNVDVILFLIDATSEKIGKGDALILNKLKELNKKVILVINKMDLIKREKLLNIMELYSKEYNFKAIIPISAMKNQNIEEILNEIEKYIPNGPAYYDIEEYTDQTARQIIEELIREKALMFLDEEIPHGILVEIEKMNLRKTTKGQEIYDVEAIIYVLKNSHKGIVIGKNGEMLKKIGTYARKDSERILDTKINLKIWVKVKQDWQDNASIVKKFENK